MQHFRLGFLTPGSPGVFEVANQLFLLGIHTDDRPASGGKDLLLALDRLELKLSIRMGSAGLALFRIHPQGVAELALQPPHRWRTGRMTCVLQAPAELTQAAAYPFLLAHRIACRIFLHQSVQRSL
jgi:hypothetical protein